MLDAALDAITHACESLWSRRRTLITDALAEKALETLINRLPAALNDRDPEACQEIMEASSAANLACGNTGLALIHALTMSPDVPLPHGYQNGCLLLAVSRFNRSLMDPRHQVLVDQLEPLFQKIGWPGLYQAKEIDDHNAFLMVRASTGNPFRANNIRDSSGKWSFLVRDFANADIAIQTKNAMKFCVHQARYCQRRSSPRRSASSWDILEWSHAPFLVQSCSSSFVVTPSLCIRIVDRLIKPEWRFLPTIA